jgi:hypothetical protein
LECGFGFQIARFIQDVEMNVLNQLRRKSMKWIKHLLVLAIALCSTASLSKAQATIQFLGGGSSALFLELGQAAQSSASTATPCVWTQASSATILARDDRTSPATDEKGNYWVTWGKGSGTCAAPAGAFNIYSYQQLDSVVGDKCYFLASAAGSGCIQVLTVAAGTAGGNLLGTGFGPDTPIPAAVISAINGKRYFVVGTDIRPEDAKFASKRMFTTCGTTLTREPFGTGTYATVGLGYQTSTTGVGLTVKSFFSAKLFNVIDFNISGTDPITAKPVRTFVVNVVGAQPIVVAVSPAGGTGIGAATDISTESLAEFLDGTSGLATDIDGPTAADAVTVLVREPLSGTYNTMEYSVPNTVQFRTSQDANNCLGASVNSNPLDVASANGKVAGAARKRVIGTGEMVAELQSASTSTLGYFFWSAGNAAKFTSTNGKYLTVNGVDPLVNSYSETNGVLPATAAELANVTFNNLNAGDYPIWSALRLVSTSPTPVGVTNLIAGAQTLNSTQHDFITLTNLKTWHSHFTIGSIGISAAANGATIHTVNDLCSGGNAEAGGDAGGANINKTKNSDFCADFGSKTGVINKNN